MAKTKKLREGFTTGSASAAAAAAALHMLLGKSPCPASVSIALPPFEHNDSHPVRRLSIPVASGTVQAADRCTAQVIKDGGDDPDATHGSIIEVEVWLTPTAGKIEEQKHTACCPVNSMQTKQEPETALATSGAQAQTASDIDAQQTKSVAYSSASGANSEGDSIGRGKQKKTPAPIQAGATHHPAKAVVIPADTLVHLANVLQRQPETPPAQTFLNDSLQECIQPAQSPNTQSLPCQHSESSCDLSCHAETLQITLHGGQGVGTVTLPGLPVAVGEPAINPEPRKQIAAAVLEICAQYGFSGSVDVTIRVPEGEERAQRTFNKRLGIHGGISILGTRGTVKPYSHGAWRATITQGMDVAASCGSDIILLSTGRRSERMLMELYPAASETAFVQVADFARFSLQEAAKRGFAHIVWGCFFGKLVKLGEGHHYTHAHSAQIDFALLAKECRSAGLSDTLAEQVVAANTARHALELMEQSPNQQPVLEHLTRKALAAARKHVTDGPRLTVHLFDFDGRHLIVADD